MTKTPIFGKKNVLITGGAGFIGSHLCEVLLKKNRVICLDNISNGHLNNIEHLLKDADFEFIKADINDPLNLDELPELERFKIKFQGIQEIYHLACPTSAQNFDKYKMQTLFSNSLGSKNVLDWAVKYNAKVLFGSSSVIYGPRRSEDARVKEEEWGSVNLLSPRACYDEGKRFSETMFETYAQVHNVEIKIARIFRTYGPRLKLFDGQMIVDFIVAASHNEDLVIYGDESFSSSLLYIDDLIDGLRKLMEAPKDIGPINFGDDKTYLLSDVAKLIISKMNSSSKIKFEPPLQFITPLGVPDISKAREALGWFPLASLEEGLQKTIDYTLANEKLILAK